MKGGFMCIKRELLQNILNKALDMVYEKDAYLINHKPEDWILNTLEEKAVAEDINKAKKYHIGERAIVFRVGHYFQTLMDEKYKDLQSYHLDCEYNRNLFDVKKMLEFAKGTYPDLILHERGSNRKNLIVIEFKGWWNSDDGEKDIKKIKSFTSPKESYKYQFGVFVRLTQKRTDCIPRWFENEKEIN